MADNDPRPLTRPELERFLPNQRAVRAFEKLFDLIPADLIELSTQVEDAALDAATAHANSHVINNNIATDSIDVNRYAPVTVKPGRLRWSSGSDALLVDSEDATCVVGQDIYLRFLNLTGATLTKGVVIGLSLSGPYADKYIADGTVPTVNIIGLVVSDTAAGELGMAITTGALAGVDTTGATYGETWAVGDIFYASDTVAGGLTVMRPSAPSWSIPLGVITVVSATDGVLSVRATIEQSLYFGFITKTANQTPAAINTAYVITLDNVEVANGVSIISSSRITVENSGLYAFNVAFQLVSSTASLKNVWLWFRKNGTDVTNSAIKVSLDNLNSVVAPSRSLFFPLAAGDYIELVWAADSTAVTMRAAAATGFAPGTPACAVTVEQIQQ